MHDDITQRVIEVIVKNQHVDLARVTPESTFGIDSLDGLHLLFALEEEFQVEIPDDAGREFTSVQQAVNGIVVLLDKKPVHK